MAAVDGGAPVHPPMDGLHLDGMHVLQTMGDTFARQHVLAAGGARSALVVERHLRLLDEWEASSGCWLGQVSSSWPIARAGVHGGWWRPLPARRRPLHAAARGLVQLQLCRW
jgi:hypothetical protein